MCKEERDGCHNCINGSVQRGYGIGNFDYWCRKQNRQKSKYTLCLAYENKNEK